MPPEIRRAFVWVAFVIAIGAVIWASRMKSLPPADFTLQNGTDPKTIDPARATGDVSGRIIFELFEGLLRLLPEGEVDPKSGQQPLVPKPGMAESYEITNEGRTYTFKLRPGIRWSDGTKVTSHDFAWSWQRTIHPETASEYAMLFYAIPFAKQYNLAKTEIGDRVEVELWDRPGETESSEGNIQHFPRGTMLYGTLCEIRKPDRPDLPPDADEKETEKAELEWQDQWVYEVDVAELRDGVVQWDGPTKKQSFMVATKSPVAEPSTKRMHSVLVAFGKLGGVETPDDQTFVVHLSSPVPYFPNLVAYYPMFPVNRKCIEQYGAPMWTKPANIVTNGPYKLQLRRLRDRIRLAKNEDYYNAANVSMETIDMLSLESANTALNMYETGQIQWVYDLPTALLEELDQRSDFVSAAKLSVYFYKLNTSRKPLDDSRVRRALAMAIDREQIVKQVTKAGQLPAFTLVPPGLPGYEGPTPFKYDIEKAQALLAEAGFPGGQGFPKLNLTYNTSETHRPIAEVIQQQWQNNLNIKVDLQNMEWGSFQEFVQQEKYDIARYGWIGDYPDPNTFLDLWITDGAQNNTNWSHPEYDRLLSDAGSELDPRKRLDMLKQAEQIFVDEIPVIPIYFYTASSLVKPNVEGFAPNAQDNHPLQLLRYKE